MKNLLIFLSLLFVGCDVGTMGSVPTKENDVSSEGSVSNSGEGEVVNGSSNTNDANVEMDAPNHNNDAANGNDAKNTLPEVGTVKNANLPCQNQYDDCMTICCLHGEESGNGPCSEQCERIFQVCQNKKGCRLWSPMIFINWLPIWIKLSHHINELLRSP